MNNQEKIWNKFDLRDKFWLYLSGCASTCNDHSLQVENSALADYARSITDRFVRGDTVPLNKGSTVINNKTNNDNDDIFES